MDKQTRILILLCGLIIILLGSSYFLIQAERVQTLDKETDNLITEEKNDLEIKEEPEELPVPESRNGLMIGFDQSNRLTDVLMVGHIDTKEDMIKVISIPRDFLIDFTKEPFRSIKKAHPTNRIAHCKINEIYINMGSSKEGLQTLKEVIEAITGIKIDYLATINVSGFKEVVDIVGGVEFDVPQRMYKMDPTQNPPLRIDLKPGLQVLDGEKAQGLVRYRGYRLGDLQRIKVQQAFITALFKKIAMSDTEQMTNLVKQIFKMFKADFGIVEIMDYLNYYLDKDITKLMSTTNMITLEGYPDTLKNGAAVLRFDVNKNQKLVEELLEKTRADIEREKQETETEKSSERVSGNGD